MKVFIYDSGYLAELYLYDDNEVEFTEQFIIGFSNHGLLKADDEIRSRHNVEYTISQDDFDLWVSYLERQQKIIDTIADKRGYEDILYEALNPSEILSYNVSR